MKLKFMMWAQVIQGGGDRKNEVEDGTGWVAGFRPDLTVVGFGDGAADGESHAEALFLGGVEGGEDGLRVCGESAAGVGEGEVDGIPGVVGRQEEAALVRVICFHGFAGIED